MKRRRHGNGEEIAAPPETHPHPKRRTRHQMMMKRPLLLGLALLLTVLLLTSYNNPSLWSLVEQHKATTFVASRTHFPKYGTAEFAQQCNWTVSSSNSEQPLDNCTFLLRVYRGSSNEGIAEWISEAVSGFILAKQTHCRLLMEYSDNVDIHQVMRPIVDNNNWTVPFGFACNRRCVHVTRWTATDVATEASLHDIETKIGKRIIARVPFYRQADSPIVNEFQDLENELAGFDVKTGMACALAALFDLSPSASQFQSDLFTRLLPTLRDKNALVVTIYIRTGQTDRMAKAEKDGTTTVPDEATMNEQYREMAVPCLQCALQLEETYLSKPNNDYTSRVVWMLVTDSEYLKQWIPKKNRISSFGQSVVNHLPHEILTTSSRGVHTRSSRNPSTLDFAEAFIDWYLIGESDMVVANSRYSFGATAALRTNSPLYEAKLCSEVVRFAPSPEEK